jgi:tetratricopeptide (TPR) repeat protein
MRKEILPVAIVLLLVANSQQFPVKAQSAHGRKISMVTRIFQGCETSRAEYMRLYRSGRYSEALEICQAVCASTDARARDFYMKGEIQECSNHFLEASKSFEQAWQLDHSDEESAVRLVESLLAAKDFFGARLKAQQVFGELKDQSSRQRIAMIVKIAEKGAPPMRSSSRQGKQSREVDR